MSATMQPMALDLSLPWQPDPAQEKKFKDLLKRLFIPLLLLFLIIPFLPQIEPEFEEQEVDISVTQVLLEPVIEPEPEPAPVVVEKPKPVPTPKPKVEPKPEPKEQILKKEPEPALIKTEPKETPAQPPTTAESSQVETDAVTEEISVRSSQGLDELSNQLSAVRNSLDLSKLQTKNVTDSQLGTAARSSRDRLGSNNVSRQSGGVGVDGELMNNESTDLATHTTVAVAGLEVGENSISGDQAYIASRQGLRDMESIRRTLEGEKSSIYTLYQRVLAENPDIAGRFIFKLWIEPDGTVSKVSLISSELNLEDLENDLLQRIKRVNFGPEDVAQTPVEYTYVFLPS